MHFEKRNAFQNASNYIFFPENLQKNRGFTCNLGRVWFSLTQVYFYLVSFLLRHLLAVRKKQYKLILYSGPMKFSMGFSIKLHAIKSI